VIRIEKTVSTDNGGQKYEREGVVYHGCNDVFGGSDRLEEFPTTELGREGVLGQALRHRRSITLLCVLLCLVGHDMLNYVDEEGARCFVVEVIYVLLLLSIVLITFSMVLRVMEKE
jgi:hypothetical protein